MKTAIIIAALLNLTALVNAHGHVSSVQAKAGSFKGSIPGTDNPVDSPIRLINDIDPVKDVNSNDMVCGRGAKAAKLNAKVQAGETIQIGWATGTEHWVHNTGAAVNYLASCGDDTCDSFDPSGAEWFKIFQQGRVGSDKHWIQQDLFNGKTIPVTIPAKLPAGNYMLQHTLISLHLAETPGGVEFYPSCIQLQVTSDATGDLSSISPTTSMPGTYKLTDPGILVKDAFDTNAVYHFPGPAIANIAGGGNNNDNDDDSAPQTTGRVTSTAPAPKKTPSPKAVGSSPSGPASDESSISAGTTSTDSASSPTVTANPGVATVTVVVTVTAPAPTATSPSDDDANNNAINPPAPSSPAAAIPSAPSDAQADAYPKLAYRSHQFAGPRKMMRVVKRH